MSLHQGTVILINSMDSVTNIINPEAINNVQIPACCIATTPIKLTGGYVITTPCILEVDTNEIITIQNSQLVMLSVIHLKDEVEPVQVPLTYKFVI